MSLSLRWPGRMLVRAALLLASSGSSLVMAQGNIGRGFSDQPGSGLGVGDASIRPPAGSYSLPHYSSVPYPYSYTFPHPYHYSYSYPYSRLDPYANSLYPYSSSYPFSPANLYGSTGTPTIGYHDAIPDINLSRPSHQVMINDRAAHLTIEVPDPDAIVKIDGKYTEATGTVRHFRSPELAPGNYRYEVEATWRENDKQITLRRTIKVEPGADYLVTFTSPQD